VFVQGLQISSTSKLDWRGKNELTNYVWSMIIPLAFEGGEEEGRFLMVIVGERCILHTIFIVGTAVFRCVLASL